MTFRAGSGAALAGLLGVAAAVLVSCSGSGGTLIPVANAGPLVGDFEAVRKAAERGDGSCTATEAALLRTEQDFDGLPASVDAGLRKNLHQGIDNLRARALVLCAEPLVQITTANTTAKTTTTTHTTTEAPAETQTTSTQTVPTTSTPTSTSPEGGTPAPGTGETGASGQGGGTGVGESGSSSGSGAGESGAAGGAGAASPSQEGVK